MILTTETSRRLEKAMHKMGIDGRIVKYSMAAVGPRNGPRVGFARKDGTGRTFLGYSRKEVLVALERHKEN